jgi:mRNA interferase MazF
MPIGQPSRGEIWTADLDPTEGHEQAGERPVLILSTNMFNHGLADLVIIVPLTRTGRRIPMHVVIDPPEGGVTERSYILCDNIRTISKGRLGNRPWGTITSETMARVEDHVRILLEL